MNIQIHLDTILVQVKYKDLLNIWSLKISLFNDGLDYSSNEIILYILILEGPSLDKPTNASNQTLHLASFQAVLLMLQLGKGKADSTCSITNLIFLENYAEHFLWLEAEEMPQ